MLAGLKIVADVVSYRLQRLEMANLGAAASIAIVLRLPWAEVAHRTLFAFVLNVLVYLNNDYVDVQIDLRSGDKDAEKARYLSEHLRSAFFAQWVLLVLLGAAAVVYDRGLLVPLLAGGGICFWYSARLKNHPYLDILAMIAWGVAMPMCGSPIDRVLGLSLALQLGLFSGVFEAIQVIRDTDEDAQQGMRTTGVVLGKARTLTLARMLMVGASVYAALLMQPLAAAISIGALAIPFNALHVERYWTQVKLVYGATWLWLCGFLLVRAHSAGLLVSVDHAARYG